MDISRLDTDVQKLFFQALQLARLHNHRYLEIDHIIYEFISNHNAVVNLSSDKRQFILSLLNTRFQNKEKESGAQKIIVSPTLQKVIGQLQTKTEKIRLNDLWLQIIDESPFIGHESTPSTPTKPSTQKPSDFQPFDFDNLAKTPSDYKKADSVIQEMTPDQREILEQFTQNMTQAIDHYDPIIGRELEVRRCLEILGRKNKNNPILIGEPGVGKTAIVESLARHIKTSRPTHVVLALDLASLISGAKYRGEFEQRLKNLTSILTIYRQSIVLFIDEIHMLIGAGGQEGTVDAANFLKPILARGEIQLIGATTFYEYRRFIEKDAALERRFQPVHVEEPSEEQTLFILRGLHTKFESFHQVRIADDAYQAAIQFSKKYLPKRRFPDKAIDLIDEAASRLKMELTFLPRETEYLSAEVQRLAKAMAQLKQQRREQENFLLEIEYQAKQAELDELMTVWETYKASVKTIESLREKQAKLKTELSITNNASVQMQERKKIEDQLALVRAEMNLFVNEHPSLKREVNRKHISEVVSAWTGIDTSRILEEPSEALRALDHNLKNSVFGQESAIKAVVKSLKRSLLGFKNQSGPVASFLFMGPTGVGKTETAKKIAHHLMGSENFLIRVDMSEYQEAHSVSGFIGSKPGYVGYDQGTSLINQLKIKPHAIVLLDEIEKAHPQVLDLLLQILSDARITTGSGETLDLSQNIFILTSNYVPDRTISLSLSSGISAAIESPDQDCSESFLREFTSAKLRPELVNRIDEIILFKNLGKKEFTRILKNDVRELNEALESRRMKLHLSKGLSEALVAKAMDSVFGARDLKRLFQRYIHDSIVDLLLTSSGKAVEGQWTLHLDVEKDQIYFKPTMLKDYYLMPARA